VLGLGSGEREGMNAALQAVLAAGVPVLAFELEGARLSTAFLSLTAAGSTAAGSTAAGSTAAGSTSERLTSGGAR
jgi:hypothetical protein